MWPLVAVALALLCVALFVDGQRRERRLRDQWELALSPRSKALVAVARARVEGELGLIDLMYSDAEEKRAAGQAADAIEFLDAGCRLIEAYCPTMLRSLAALSVLSRMASAIAPVQPLRPRGLKLRELRRLALVNQFVHEFLVSTQERLRLRVFILARGFMTIARLVARATFHLRERPTPAAPEWQRLDEARHDLRSLSDEWLESLRILLVSLSATPKEKNFP
jgi:hypothetical protein